MKSNLLFNFVSKHKNDFESRGKFEPKENPLILILDENIVSQFHIKKKDYRILSSHITIYESIRKEDKNAVYHITIECEPINEGLEPLKVRAYFNISNYCVKLSIKNDNDEHVFPKLKTFQEIKKATSLLQFTKRHAYGFYDLFLRLRSSLEQRINKKIKVKLKILDKISQKLTFDQMILSEQDIWRSYFQELEQTIVAISKKDELSIRKKVSGSENIIVCLNELREVAQDKLKNFEMHKKSEQPSVEVDLDNSLLSEQPSVEVDIDNSLLKDDMNEILLKIDEIENDEELSFWEKTLRKHSFFEKELAHSKTNKTKLYCIEKINEIEQDVAVKNIDEILKNKEHNNKILKQGNNLENLIKLAKKALTYEQFRLSVYKRRKKALYLLFEHKKDVNINKDSGALIKYAYDKNYCNIFEILLHFGAISCFKYQLKGFSFPTTLIHHAFSNHQNKEKWRMAKSLIKYNTPLEFRNKRGYTPDAYLFMKDNSVCPEPEKLLPYMNDFFDTIAKSNRKECFDITFLQGPSGFRVTYATFQAMYNRLSTLELLVSRGGERIVMFSGEIPYSTPLETAAVRGYFDICKFLLSLEDPEVKKHHKEIVPHIYHTCFGNKEEIKVKDITGGSFSSVSVKKQEEISELFNKFMEDNNLEKLEHKREIVLPYIEKKKPRGASKKSDFVGFYGSGFGSVGKNFRFGENNARTIVRNVTFVPSTFSNFLENDNCNPNDNSRRTKKKKDLSARRRKKRN